VVFKLDRDGEETVLYTFSGGADGFQPFAGLVRDRAGRLYGSAFVGGNGFGVVFEVDRSANETVLHSFTGADGFGPLDLLLHNGSLYGMTDYGGAYGAGVVFKLTPQ